MECYKHKSEGIMKKEYKEHYKNSSQLLNAFIKSDNVEEYLNGDLHNFSEENDYETWIEGTKSFINKNHEKLSKWVNQK